MRPIDADAALEAIRTMQTYKLFSGDDMILVDKAQVQAELMMLPPAQPERKKGKWVYDNGLKQFFCDQCGEPSLTYDDIYIYSMDFPNFCPECGADMRGGVNGQK